MTFEDSNVGKVDESCWHHITRLCRQRRASYLRPRVIHHEPLLYIGRTRLVHPPLQRENRNMRPIHIPGALKPATPITLIITGVARVTAQGRYQRDPNQRAWLSIRSCSKPNCIATAASTMLRKTCLWRAGYRVSLIHFLNGRIQPNCHQEATVRNYDVAAQLHPPRGNIATRPPQNTNQDDCLAAGTMFLEGTCDKLP